MFVSSLPVALDNGAGVPGLAVSMFFVGLGVGGVKSTISPFIGERSLPKISTSTDSCALATDIIPADQYPQQKPRVVRQKNGELAVIETSRTLQLVYNAFYWYTDSCPPLACRERGADSYRFTNIASLSAIPATFLEHEFDFWTAYLMATISLVISLGALLSLKNKLGQSAPSPSPLVSNISLTSACEDISQGCTS